MDYQRRAKQLIQVYKIHIKKHLGQNFVVDDCLLNSMVSYADLTQKDVVLEVGAGLGFLTRLLSSRCKQIIAVEVDPKLATLLRTQLSDLKNVELIEGDVLEARVPRFDKIVSTPPYSISSPLLFWLLGRPFQLAVLAFQEEFATRLTAPVGSKDYSRLTVATYYRADVELLDHVSRTSFYPPPDVDSTIVRIKPRSKPFTVRDEHVFFDLLQTTFTQRNKKLRNAVLPFLTKYGLGRDQAKLLADTLTFHDKRVRRLAPEDFGALSNEIVDKKRSLQ